MSTSVLSYYELAYLEINRIIIQHDIINVIGIVDKDEIELLNGQVKADIDKNPNQKEQVYDVAFKKLLEIVKVGIDTYKPSTKEKYSYKNFVGFLEDELADDKRAVLVAKAIIRLNKFYNKNRSYLYD